VKAKNGDGSYGRFILDNPLERLRTRHKSQCTTTYYNYVR